MNAYADIMQHPRYRLRSHKPMPLQNRAAQFSAFAALTGYEELIDDTAHRKESFTEACGEGETEWNWCEL